MAGIRVTYQCTNRSKILSNLINPRPEPTNYLETFEFQNLTPEEYSVIMDDLEDFRLSGADWVMKVEAIDETTPEKGKEPKDSQPSSTSKIEECKVL